MKPNTFHAHTIVLSSRPDEEYSLSEPHVSRDDIQNILGGIRPRNLGYYRRALVHKSVLKTVQKNAKLGVLDYLTESNERLEFLGDAVLNLIVANILFRKYEDKDEGFLTRIRTKLVSGKNCTRMAKKLQLGKHMLLSNHVQSISGRCNNRILEDALEAFIGAIYVDLGFVYAEKFVSTLIEPYLNSQDLLVDTNYKDVLLRYSQKMGYPHPTYLLVKTEGLPHERFFTVNVRLGNDSRGTGSAKNKKLAEQLSAKNAIALIPHKDLEGIVNRDREKG